MNRSALGRVQPHRDCDPHSSPAGGSSCVGPPAPRACAALWAVVFAAVVGPDPDRFYLTPLGLGLVYLPAAAVGGRRGAYWATAIVLLAWGAAVVWLREGRPDLVTAGVYMTAVGVGAVAGMLLARRGFAVDALGLTATMILAGLALAFARQWDTLVEARAYALLVGVVGLVNAIGGAVAGRAAEV